MQAIGHGTAENKLKAILSLATELARSEGIAAAVEAVLDTLTELTGVTRSAVLLFDNDGVCRFAGSRGLSERYRAAVDGHCPWQESACDAHPIIVADATRDP